MPPTTKTLSPAELAKLEAAFATDPASQAYKPLAEAYLAMGRYMEAMVVCKKGVKAHPSLADPRVLLARVYADQGKDKKALEELQGALQIVPSDKSALRMTAQLQWKGGERETAKATIVKAFEADPSDVETHTAMRELGIEPPVMAMPQQAPMMANVQMGMASSSLPGHASGQLGPGQLGPGQLGPGQLGPGQLGLGQPGYAQVVQPMAGQVQGPQIQGPMAGQIGQPMMMPVPGNGASAPNLGQVSVPNLPVSHGTQRRPAAAQRVAQPRAVQQTRSFESEDPGEELSDPNLRRRQGGGGFAKAMFFMLAFAVPVAAGAYYGIGQWIAKRNREVNRLITSAQDLLKTDTYAAYQQVCAQGEEALDKDPNSALANRMLAYAYVVRWGEHEHDDTIKQRAEENLREGKASSQEKGLSYQYAAEALFSFYSGKGSEALRTMEDRVKAAEAENRKSSLLYQTLGVLQMNQGDLERSKESLDKALAIAPDDPRVHVALGTMQRRRGNDTQALSHFAKALDYTRKSHPEALVGSAVLILDQPEPQRGYVTAAKYIEALLKSEVKPSPRQLAMAHMTKALLIARVNKDMADYAEPFAKELETGTSVTRDATKAAKDVAQEETEAFGLDKTNPDLFILKARRLFWTKRIDEAVAEVRKAIDASNTTANYHVELARILLLKEGGEAQAEEAMKKALTLVPGSPKLLFMLGKAQFQMKKMEDARQTLERATSDDKVKNGEGRLLLARIYRDEKKDMKRSADLFERAAADYSSDNAMASISYDELGYTRELANEKDKARAAYEKALNADRENAPAYCHYARLLIKDGQANDKDKVKAVASEYLKLDPKGECAPDMVKAGGSVAPTPP